MTCLLCGLCACGDSGDSAPTDPSSSGSIVVGVSPATDDLNESGSQPNPENSTDTASNEAIDDPLDEPMATMVEGLILMTTTDINFRDPKIYCVDIETGESRLIAGWDFRPRPGDIIYYYLGAGFRCGRQDCFADDYSKIAVSRSDSQSGQTCAGWLDADGNFFNVSEALGRLDRGDFDDAVQDYAVGFMDDEFFIYRQFGGAEGYYYVPLNNLDSSAIQEGLPFPGCEGGDFPTAKISDYIGDSRFLINASEGFTGTGVSKILNMATGEETNYIPGTSRMSWHGVFSPDGSQVAFMSQPKSGIEKDIYIMPLEGGDPVKVPTEGFALSDQQTCENGPNIGDQCAMLVDWR